MITVVTFWTCPVRRPSHGLISIARSWSLCSSVNVARESTSVLTTLRTSWWRPCSPRVSPLPNWRRPTSWSWQCATCRSWIVSVAWTSQTAAISSVTVLRRAWRRSDDSSQRHPKPHLHLTWCPTSDKDCTPSIRPAPSQSIFRPLQVLRQYPLLLRYPTADTCRIEIQFLRPAQTSRSLRFPSTASRLNKLNYFQWSRHHRSQCGDRFEQQQQYLQKHFHDPVQKSCALQVKCSILCTKSMFSTIQQQENVLQLVFLSVISWFFPQSIQRCYSSLKSINLIQLQTFAYDKLATCELGKQLLLMFAVQTINLDFPLSSCFLPSVIWKNIYETKHLMHFMCNNDWKTLKTNKNMKSLTYRMLNPLKVKAKGYHGGFIEDVIICGCL